MNELYSHYLEAFKTSVIINPIGEHQFSSPSRSKENVFHMIHYDGTGLPMCDKVTCEAARFGMPCAHQAATIAYVHPEIQRLWDHRRIFEARSLWLSIRQGKTNPRQHPKIRKAMANIEERFPRAPLEPKCTNCGAALKLQDKELCLKCRQNLSEIWPGCPEFAAELEAVDKDEAMRLKLGMGE